MNQVCMRVEFFYTCVKEREEEEKDKKNRVKSFIHCSSALNGKNISFICTH